MKIIFCFFVISLYLYPLQASSPYENPADPWGVDIELVNLAQSTRPEQPHAIAPKVSLGQKTCRGMIRFFQVYISPIDGPRSSFAPTSSQYAMEAIMKYGIFKGIALGCDRLMRENKETWVYERSSAYDMERKIDPVK